MGNCNFMLIWPHEFTLDQKQQNDLKFKSISSRVTLPACGDLSKFRNFVGSQLLGWSPGISAASTGALVSCPLTSYQTWLGWATECSRSDGISLGKLCHKRLCGFLLGCSLGSFFPPHGKVHTVGNREVQLTATWWSLDADPPAPGKLSDGILIKTSWETWS